MIRVVLTGSESTGKTTLAEALARHYGAELVPEFVRSYAEQRGGIVEYSDHGPIARGQMALEDERFAAARAGRGLVILDTDLLSTAVYCGHYWGRCPPWIDELAKARRPDVYLLCETDVPWVADGVRDRGDRREEMQTLFRDAVIVSGSAHVTLRGQTAERFAEARRVVDDLISARTRTP